MLFQFRLRRERLGKAVREPASASTAKHHEQGDERNDLHIGTIKSWTVAHEAVVNGQADGMGKGGQRSDRERAEPSARINDGSDRERKREKDRDEERDYAELVG